MNAGTSLSTRYGATRSSALPTATETRGGTTYQVISNIRFELGDGYLYVEHPNTIIRNSVFTTTAAVSNTSAMIQTSPAVQHLIVETSEFYGGPAYNRGVQSDTANLTVTGSRFRNTGESAIEKNDRNGASDLTVTGNYIRNDAGWPAGQHADGIQVGGAHNVTITNNTVLTTSRNTDGGASNSALGLWAELGDVTGVVTIQGNLLGGGGYTMYLQQKTPYRWHGPVNVTDNTFDVRYEPHSGIWGSLYPSGWPATLTWTGNRYSDGTPLELGNTNPDG